MSHIYIYIYTSFFPLFALTQPQPSNTHTSPNFFLSLSLSLSRYIEELMFFLGLFVLNLEICFESIWDFQNNTLEIYIQSREYCGNRLCGSDLICCVYSFVCVYIGDFYSIFGFLLNLAIDYATSAAAPTKPPHLPKASGLRRFSGKIIDQFTGASAIEIDFVRKISHFLPFEYIYIYIYMCVCVCVCITILCTIQFDISENVQQFTLICCQYVYRFVFSDEFSEREKLF